MSVTRQLKEAKSKPVEVDLPISKRPLTGGDVQALRASHALSTSELVVALALASPQALKKLMAADLVALSVEQEMLLRMYLQFPNFPKWGEVTPLQAFEVMYGEALSEYVGTDVEGSAKRHLGCRFAAALGRTPYATYRWLFVDHAQSKPKPVVTRFLQKIMEVPDPRGVFERLARVTFRVRGVDFDAAFPMVDKDNPPVRRRPGPRVKKTGTALKIPSARKRAVVGVELDAPAKKTPTKTVVAKKAPAKQVAVKKVPAKKTAVKAPAGRKKKTP